MLIWVPPARGTVPRVVTCIYYLAQPSSRKSPSRIIPLDVSHALTLFLSALFIFLHCRRTATTNCVKYNHQSEPGSKYVYKSSTLGHVKWPEDSIEENDVWTVIGIMIHVGFCPLAKIADSWHTCIQAMRPPPSPHIHDKGCLHPRIRGVLALCVNEKQNPGRKTRRKQRRYEATGCWVTIES